MNAVDMIAITNTQVMISEGSWLGNFGAAGLGVGLLVGSTMLAKKRRGPWSEKSKEKINKKGFDFYSLMSCTFGFAGVTALLGSTGMISDLVRWIQSLFTWAGEIEMIASLGMAVFCLIAAIKVFTSANDPEKDIMWGGILALMFPLGGGIFASTSITVAETIVQVVNGVPSA